METTKNTQEKTPVVNHMIAFSYVNKKIDFPIGTNIIFIIISFLVWLLFLLLPFNIIKDLPSNKIYWLSSVLLLANVFMWILSLKSIMYFYGLIDKEKKLVIANEL